MAKGHRQTPQQLGLPTAVTIPACKDCQAYFSVGEDLGECRHSPATVPDPTRIQAAGTVGKFLCRRGDDWCLQFKARPGS